MKKLFQRATSLLLCIAMVLCLVGVPGFPCLAGLARAADPTTLYSENFDEIALNAGENDNGWYLYRSSGSTTTAAIKNGALHITGSTAAKSYDIIYLNNGATWSNYTLEADFTYLQESGWFGLAYNVNANTTYQKGGIALTGGSGDQPQRVSLNGLVNNSWKNNTEGTNKTNFSSPLAVGSTVRFRIVSNGANSTLSYAIYDSEGVLGAWVEALSVSNINSNTQSGTIGIMLGSGKNSTSVVVDNITVTSNEAGNEVLFTEDFSYDLVEGDNTDLGWHLYLTGSKATTATINDGAMYITGSKSDTGYDIVYLNNGAAWKNYTLEADFTYLSSTGWFGFAYNVTGSGQYQKGGITIANRVSLNGRYGGKWVNDTANVNKKDFTTGIVQGDTVRIKIYTNGANSTMYYAKYTDGVLGQWVEALSVSNINANTQSGSIGIMLGSGSSTTSVKVDNITVTTTAHTCTVSEAWTSNDTHHWHACTVEGCTETPNPETHGYAPHSYDDELDTTCECGYVRTVIFNPAPIGPEFFDTELVLYEEDFDDVTGTVALNAGINYTGAAAGWIYSQKSANGSAYIQDGKLYFTGSGYDVIYRDGGQTWGNYVLEADFCYTDPNVGWGSMLYNVQSATKFQKVGISLAGSASANGYDGGWTNNSSTDNKFNMTTDPSLTIPTNGTPFRMRVVVENKTASFYYAMLNEDGTQKTNFILLKAISNIPANAQTGSIGFMTSNGSLASFWVDNIKCYSYTYVTYTEDFEGYADTTLTPNATNTTVGLEYVKNYATGSAYIQEGRLYLSGGGADFDGIFFTMGKNWTNYTLEADVTYTAVSGGWGGLLLRATDISNFQKAALTTANRANLNGQLKGSWYKDSDPVTKRTVEYTSTMNIPTRLRVVAEEGKATLYAAFYDTTTGEQGEFIEIMSVDGTFAAEHMTGTIGLIVGANANTKTCDIWVDNIVVYRGTDRFAKEPEPANAADIYEPVSGIVNPPVVIQQLTGTLPAAEGERAAVVMMEVDANMNVLASDGAVLTTVSSFIDTYRRVLIPAFIIDSQAEADALSALLKEKNLIDCYVMADGENAALVKAVRQANTAISGALIFDDLNTEAERKNARALVTDNMCYVAISRTALTEESMIYFNVRQIAAWSWAEDADGVYTAIVNGYHGVISTDVAAVYDVYESITEPTVSGKPIIIAHRGANNQQGVGYPENTMIGYHAAGEVFGAQAIEIDVRITKDGFIYLMHDSTVDRTTNGTGAGANYTLEELKSLVVDEIPAYQDTAEVPAFEDLLKEIAENKLDTVVYCHINVKSDANVSAFSYLVNKYGLQDNIIFFISYVNRTDYNSNVDRVASSTAYNFTDAPVVLDGVVFTSGDTDLLSSAATDLEGIVNFRQGLTAYNFQPLFYKYANYGAQWGTESFYYQLSARGFVNSHSITNGQATMDQLALTGAGATGYLTDSLNKSDDYHYRVVAGDETLAVGQTLELNREVLMIMGSTEAECGVTQLSGPTLVATENGYTLNEAGTVTLVYYATRTTEGGSTYRVYSQPVTVTFEVRASGVTLDKETLTLTHGDTAALVATVQPANATNAAVTWTSSDERVVTVDEKGNLVAVAPGTATITVTTVDGGHTATCVVTVNAKVFTVTFDYNDGVTGNVTASVTDGQPLGQLPAPAREGYTFDGWFDADGKQVTADTIVTGDMTLTAKWTWILVTEVVLSDETLTLTEGDSAALTVTVNPADAADTSVTWTSSDERVVTVDENGNLVAVAPGTATITVTANDGGVSATCVVTVNAKVFTVTFNYNDGVTENTTVSVANGQALGQLPGPVREGYVFEGWFDADGNPVTAETVITADLTVTALWSEVVPPTGDILPAVVLALLTSAAGLVVLRKRRQF